VKIKDAAGIAYDIRYISDAYSALKMEKKALEYNLKALYYLKYYDTISQSILFGNIGEYYFEKGNINKCEEYLKKAFTRNATVYTYAIAADIFITKGKYDKAREIMAKAPLPTNDIEKKKMLSTLYDLNRKSENLTQALSIADSIFALNQQMGNTKEHDNLNEIQAEYDREFVAQTWMDRLIYMGAALVILVLLIILLIIRQRYKTTKVQNQLMQDRLLMGEYQTRLAEMESGKDSSATEIKEMKKKIGSLESKIYKTLQHGRECYEQIQNNGNIAKWSAKDLRDFIEYYKLMDLSFMVSLEEEYQPLTPSQCFYLIMTEAMNKDKATVQNIMNISDNALRTIKSRIKNKLVHQKYIK
jgi:tetratricopeptide (TPR) repeat protein